MCNRLRQSFVVYAPPISLLVLHPHQRGNSHLVEYEKRGETQPLSLLLTSLSSDLISLLLQLCTNCFLTNVDDGHLSPYNMAPWKSVESWQGSLASNLLWINTPSQNFYINHDYKNNSGTNNLVGLFINSSTAPGKTGSSLFTVDKFITKNGLAQMKNAEKTSTKGKDQHRASNVQHLSASLSH